MENGFFVYIVICSDKTLYTGFTTNIEARIKKHNEGKGAKYTKNRRPVRLLYSESFPTKSEAMKREYEIKQLSREQKWAIIHGKQ
jgi:putative endonuclease